MNIGAFSDDQKSVSDIDPLKAFVVKPTPDFVQGSTFFEQNGAPKIQETLQSHHTWDGRTPTRIQKKPIIQPEMCTFDEYYNSNQQHVTSTSSNIPPNIKFAQRQPTSDRYQDAYDDVQGEEIIMEKIKLGATEAEHKSKKAKIILKLQRVIKGLAHTSIKMREDKPTDECADVQIQQSQDAVEKFKNSYPVETQDDQLLAMQIQKYEKNLSKAEELLDQASLFDERSKIPFVKGLQGLIDSNTIEVLNDLDHAKLQFAGIIPLDAMDAKASELETEILGLGIQLRSEVPIEGYTSHTPVKKKSND